MRLVVSIMVLLSVLATALVSVRLHAELMRMRCRIEGMERDRARVESDLRLATVDLERVKAPYWQLRAQDEAKERGSLPAGSGAARTPVASVHTTPSHSNEDESDEGGGR